MMTPEKIEALEAAAASWVGTPFCEGEPVKGSGASCHHAVAEIDFEAGLFPRVHIPSGPPSWANVQPKSLIGEWLDSSLYFESVLFDISNPLSCAEVGDHLGFRLGHTVHHLAILLKDGRIVHSVRTHGVVISPCIATPWLKRLERIWRLK